MIWGYPYFWKHPYYQPKQCIIIREIPENYHKFVLFDSPQMGNIMTSVKHGCFPCLKSHYYIYIYSLLLEIVSPIFTIHTNWIDLLLLPNPEQWKMICSLSQLDCKQVQHQGLSGVGVWTLNPLSMDTQLTLSLWTVFEESPWYSTKADLNYNHSDHESQGQKSSSFFGASFYIKVTHLQSLRRYTP